MAPCLWKLNRDVSASELSEPENARLAGHSGNAYHEAACRHADVVSYAFDEQTLSHVRTLIQSDHSRPEGVQGVETHERHEPLLHPHGQERLLLAKDALLSAL